MDKVLVYYISGHGFGHARRSVQIIHQLLEMKADLHVHIRTPAAPFIFMTLPKERVSIHHGIYDAGCVETDTLTINPEKTMDNLRELMDREEQIIESEVRELEPMNPIGIVSDISFFPAAIAGRLKIPSIAASNFSWDWIYEPFVSGAGVLTGGNHTPRAIHAPRPMRTSALLSKISSYYALFDELLAMPFTGISDAFKKVTPVPLVAVLPTQTKQQILQKLPEVYKDNRFKLLVGLRGGCSTDTLKQVALKSPDILFTVFFDLPDGMPQNIFRLVQTPELDFSDVLQISDAVMSKPGYGMLADCCALGIDLVGPTRFGFREDDLSIPIAKKYIRHAAMTREEYETGNWRRAIDTLKQMPKPPAVMDSSGAKVCAEIINRKFK